jgi:hypothetical protein
LSRSGAARELAGDASEWGVAKRGAAVLLSYREVGASGDAGRSGAGSRGRLRVRLEEEGKTDRWVPLVSSPGEEGEGSRVGASGGLGCGGLGRVGRVVLGRKKEGWAVVALWACSAERKGKGRGPVSAGGPRSF